jgi:hypothetical protein
MAAIYILDENIFHPSHATIFLVMLQDVHGPPLLTTTNCKRQVTN